MGKEQLGNLHTETRNPRSVEMDKMSIWELLLLMNREDEKAIEAVHEAIPQIEETVKRVIHA